MAPLPVARIDLDYPLYAVQFDPEDANRLAVSGGGGAGRSGVGNKITIIETSSQNELRKAGEIELSRNEDSVMSLAFGVHKGKTAYLHAGVNSSPQDIAKGRNEHLRTLAVEQSKSRSSVGNKAPEVRIAEQARSTFFANPHTDTYQRLLRVKGTIGAAASGLGTDPQLAVFGVSGGIPQIKGNLELPKDAQDLDIVQDANGDYHIAYCYDHELFLLNLAEKGSEPVNVFTMPEDHGERPTFRSIRFLTPDFLLCAANLSNRSGVLLLGLRMPTPDKPQARMAATSRIPRQISATSLAVADLTPPPSPGAQPLDSQFVIAVAGSDASISCYALTIHTGTKVPFLMDFYPFTTIKSAHDGNITGLDFSHFAYPKTHIREQSLKLASISLQQSVAVHSVPLKKFVDRTPREKRAPPRPVRYIVALPPQKPGHGQLMIVMALCVLFMAICGQGLIEYYGGSKPILGVHRFLPSWHGTQRVFDPPPPGLADQEILSHGILSKLNIDLSPAEGEKVVVVETTQEGAAGESRTEQKVIGAEVHDEEIHAEAKSWDELPYHQREAWKTKLRDAGAWTQDMGDSIFKGVLFGELAGVVAQAVGG